MQLRVHGLDPWAAHMDAACVCINRHAMLQSSLSSYRQVTTDSSTSLQLCSLVPSNSGSSKPCPQQVGIFAIADSAFCTEVCGLPVTPLRKRCRACVYSMFCILTTAIMLDGAQEDGQAGLQELGGNATLLFYQTPEGNEGRQAYLEKRRPDFSKFSRFP